MFSRCQMTAIGHGTDHWSFEDNNSEIYRIRFDGSVLDRLTYDVYHDHDPQWSPDDDFVFFRAGSATSGKLNRLSIVDDESRQLSRLDMKEHALSPDGHKLALVKETDGPLYSLFTMNSDGSGFRRLLQTFESVSEIKWSPDGNDILYFGYNGRPFMFEASTLSHKPMPIVRVQNAAWSPDRNWIAIVGGTGSLSCWWRRVDHYRGLD